jgi:hypothetical protein
VVDRSADDIQRDIVAARSALAQTVDELAYRTNPKRVVENAKHSLREKAQTPQGQAVIAGAGVLLLIVVIRRFRKH